uniref:adenylate cyclase n=1 Tax=Syphacia muris TaxID=451379 RepID=A0A0N5AAL4_9BILA
MVAQEGATSLGEFIYFFNLLNFLLEFYFFVVRNEKQLESEVESFLLQGIKAIKKEKWRTKHCKRFTLEFKKKEMEDKVLTFKFKLLLILTFFRNRSSLNDLRVFMTLITVFSILLTAIQSHRSELIARFDFIWKLKALAEGKEMEERHKQNRLVLQNILPAHVADYFLKDVSPEKLDYLYHEGRDNVAIMFATITEFDKFYQELDANNEGVECLRVLNEIIVDFDSQLKRKEFDCIEKIKTISTTYMVAAGLTGEVKGNTHVVAVVRFAMRLFAVIRNINEHSFNNFNLRVGINVGPLVAGVIGIRKPHYDIWGNSVNVASRMDSSGIAGKIQVTEEVKRILEQEGYELECRGAINVKGKGEMVTYFLRIPQDALNIDLNDNC